MKGTRVFRPVTFEIPIFRSHLYGHFVFLQFFRVRKRKIGNSTSPSSSSANNDQESQHFGESHPKLTKSNKRPNYGESHRNIAKSRKSQKFGESHPFAACTPPSDENHQNLARVLLDKSLAKELPLQITPVKPG